MLVFCSSPRTELRPSQEGGVRGSWLEFGQSENLCHLKKDITEILVGNFILNLKTAEVIC